MNFFTKFSAKKSATSFNPKMDSFIFEPGSAIWSGRSYEKFSEEAYVRNVIAHRAISMLATGAASIPFKLFKETGKNITNVSAHSILNLLRKPNPKENGRDLLESIYGYRLISGNAYLLAIKNSSGMPVELYALRPDRVTIISDGEMLPKAYRYRVGTNFIDYPVDQITGNCEPQVIA